jgi:uncharacterized protein
MLLRTPVILALALIGAASAGSAQTNEGARGQANTVGIVSAGDDPVSIHIVSDLAATLDGESLQILPIIGRGTVETVGDLLKRRSIDAAILPSDVLAYLRREPGMAGADQGLRYIVSLYQEQVHVLARREIRNLADLAGKRVSMGTPHSRAYITGSILFQGEKIAVEPVALDPAAAVQALRRGDIAALVHVAKKPARLFFDLNQTNGVHFLPVPLNAALASTYLPTRLGPEDYPLLIGQGEAGRGDPVSTVAIPMVLAVYNWPSGTGRYRGLTQLADRVFLRAAALHASAQQDPLWKGEFNPAETVPGWRRFAPAEARLKGEVGVGSGGSPASPPRQQGWGREEREALFEQYLRWRAERQTQGGGNIPSDEALFEEFLRSRSGQ